MTIETTLARAEADLRAGRVPLARQRLRGLVGSRPADLTVRSRLGAVYRLYGEPAQAGRWTYLDDDRDEAEAAAFEAAYADPQARMTALAWRDPEESAPTGTARERLTAVRTAASAAAGRPLAWGAAEEDEDEEEAKPGTDWPGVLGCTVVVLVLLAACGLMVFGAVTLVRQF
ncbi:DUF6584 family protein [Kitasatospora sp. NBC_01539]|uniref:DUF6584 family protein n=1 Tax=Kitasatospora sp. NBC_01539 TaxID=2903577 RepID=UPI00386009F5